MSIDKTIFLPKSIDDKISLPGNEDVVRRLQAKRSEYRDRAENPASDVLYRTDARYKEFIAAELLTCGWVDFVDLHSRLSETETNFNVRVFISAWNVISSYCTGKKVLIKGTGF